jgi:uncharacterized membrane protein YozB (DUF420 family)
MDAIFHRPGFLGTTANFAADMTLVAMLLIAALFTAGTALAKARRYDAHRGFQSTAAVLNAVFVLWMMILPLRDFVARDFMGARPAHFYWVALVHGLIGFFGLTFGLFVTARGNNLVPKPLRFRDYKSFMRVSYTLYMLATLIGLGVYLSWFVFNPVPLTY